MTIFQQVDNTIKISPEILQIPEFKALWDSHKDKFIAHQEFCYIYYSTDLRSVYGNYPETVKESKIIKDYIQIKNWKPSSLVLKAIEKYKEIQETPNMRFLQSSKKALNSLTEYFNSIDFSQMDIQGRPIYKISEVTSALEKCGKVLESLDKLNEKVEREMSVQKIRGGGQASKYEI